MLQSAVQHDAKSHQLPHSVDLKGVHCSENNPKEQYMVNISNSMLRKLFTMCRTTLDLDMAEETQIKEALLDLDSLKVSFDLASKTLRQVEPASN